MIPKNNIQEWAVAMSKDIPCKKLQDAIETAKDDLFEYLEDVNRIAELPVLSTIEMKELFGYLLSEPMMWDGERMRAFLRLGQ